MRFQRIKFKAMLDSSIVIDYLKFVQQVQTR